MLNISNIKLFTLSACPLGRTMHTVITEILNQVDGIEFEIVFVDIDTDQTNKYRVKSNPTTLFLDGKGHELYRIVGFKETNEVNAIIEDIEAGSLKSYEVYDENTESQENYTLYLFKEGELISYPITYVNQTSVKAPRITVIKQLMETRPKGYGNPFPLSASLDSIEFKGKEAQITISSTESVSEHALQRMKMTLLRTLSHYDITHVSLILKAI